MACCDQPLDKPGVQVDLRDLPEETFCCMGRMSYVLATKAAEVFTGAVHPAWDTFNERQKLDLGARAKALVVGDSDGDTDIEKAMAAVLRAMTTAI